MCIISCSNTNRLVVTLLIALYLTFTHAVVVQVVVDVLPNGVDVDVSVVDFKY